MKKLLFISCLICFLAKSTVFGQHSLDKILSEVFKNFEGIDSINFEYQSETTQSDNPSKIYYCETEFTSLKEKYFYEVKADLKNGDQKYEKVFFNGETKVWFTFNDMIARYKKCTFGDEIESLDSVNPFAMGPFRPFLLVPQKSTQGRCVPKIPILSNWSQWQMLLQDSRIEGESEKNGYKCIKVIVNRKWGLNPDVSRFSIFFAEDANFYPVAWTLLDSNKNPIIEYTIEKLISLKVGKSTF